MESIFLLLLTIVLLILGVSWLKINPIFLLLFAGLFLGLTSGMDVKETSNSLFSGFGNTLKWIGLVIFLGTLLGEILAESGGANVIANTIISVFGKENLVYSMAFIGLLVGIPVFMDVAYLTLLPTIVALSKKTGKSALFLGLSLALSLTVSHALIPPTPGPVAVSSMFNIELGSIIPTNFLVALAAVIPGTWLINRWSKREASTEIAIKRDSYEEPLTNTGYKKLLPFAALLAPILLMSTGAFINSDQGLLQFIQNPVWALFMGLGVSLFLLKREGFSSKLNELCGQAASKSAMVILITGAGGAFGQIIKDTEIVNNTLPQIGELNGFYLLLPFLLAMLLTTLTGSITVSLLTTASIVTPLISKAEIPPQLITAAICAGSLGVIHVNSSFFWLFKELHQVSVTKVLKTFSVLSFIYSILAGLTVVLIYIFIA